MAGKQKPTRKFKAYMVVSRYGHPVQENHQWGSNYIIARLKSGACVWNEGERVVHVEVRVLDGDNGL